MLASTFEGFSLGIKKIFGIMTVNDKDMIR